MNNVLNQTYRNIREIENKALKDWEYWEKMREKFIEN
jgi:hypothetical protein